MGVRREKKGTANEPGADYFVHKHVNQLLSRSAKIDTILLACTHYPLLLNKIKQFVPAGLTIVSQGEIVAKSLAKYLVQHPKMETQCSKNGQIKFCTTDSAADFDANASLFFGKAVISQHIDLHY